MFRLLSSRKVPLAAISAGVFSSLVATLSFGYASYVAPTSSDYALPRSGGTSNLTSEMWNRGIDNVSDIHERLSNFSFSGGMIGVGTSYPETKFHVQWWVDVATFSGNPAGSFIRFTGPASAKWKVGPVNSLAGFAFYNETASSYRMMISDEGNVGIGTTSPLALLHVSRDQDGAFGNGANMIIENPDSNANGGAAAIRLMRANATKWAMVNDVDGNATDNLTFWAQGGIRAMTLDAGGKVGIGTTTPFYALDIRKVDSPGLFIGGTGWGSSYGFFEAHETGGNYFKIQANTGGGGNQYLALQPEGGRVGIGTTIPGAKLEIDISNDGGDALRLRDIRTNTSGGFSIPILFSGWSSNPIAGIKAHHDEYIGWSRNALAFEVSGSEKMRIDHFGYVGIGTAAPKNLFHVSWGGGDARIQLSNNATWNEYADGLWIGVDAIQHFLLWREALPMTFYTNALERMRIDPWGNVAIGGTSASEKLDVAGNVRASGFFNSSDERLKRDIATLRTPLERLKLLRGVEFIWKDSGKPDIGFVAQEVERIYPQLVSDGSGMKSVKYGNVVAIVVEAVKKLSADVDDSSEEIARMKDELSRQRQEIDNLKRAISEK